MIKRLGISYLLGVFLALGFVVNAHNAVHSFHNLDAAGEASFYQLDQSVCDIWDSQQAKAALEPIAPQLVLVSPAVANILIQDTASFSYQHFSAFLSRAPPAIS